MRISRLILATAAVCALVCCERQGPWHDGSALDAAISLEGRKSPGGPLLCGYNHELLGRYARSTGRHAEIALSGHGIAILDSLRSGKLDVVAFPYLDSLDVDSTLVCIPSDSCGLWVFRADREVEARNASTWLRDWRNLPDYLILRQPFFDIYNPLTRVSADFISPYDSLIKVYADTLGWDWKLLAAIIYQESKFHIEARSGAGAAGLMQLVPGTAKSFGCHNPIDPEENIRAGVLLLQKIGKRYRKLAAGPEELTKYTLAAYNAGTGRLGDCINYARHLGVDVSRWDNVAAVIPDMRHDSIAALDTIKYGKFAGGRETVSYVRKVRRFHERYRHICP